MDGQVSEVVNISNDAILNLSNEFSRVCNKKRQLETLVLQ